MFELGRELKRLFRSETPVDGMTGGDTTLLELLDLNMLRAEAKAAVVAAGRVSAKDPAKRLLEAAAVWRELARRTGDPVSLRKAASLAEKAAETFGQVQHPRQWALARCEQGRCALIGAELFGDDGLNAAADFAFTEAGVAAGSGVGSALATVGRLVVEARVLLVAGDHDAVLDLARRFDAPLGVMRAHARRHADTRIACAEARRVRADLLVGAGLRLKDPSLLRLALAGLNQDLETLDPAYEPLSWARASMQKGATRAALAEMEADITEIAAAIADLAEGLEQMTCDHSPLDWARAQQTLGAALQVLGEAADSDRAFDQAVSCYDRALLILGDQPALTERAQAVYQRAVSLARKAEIACDLKGLQEAEVALRQELASTSAHRDPVGWAVRQLNFARLYEARVGVTGKDHGERAASALALSAALDVFGEHGLRSLADTTARRLEQLQAAH
jgi:tetratricopeptide (TPR) repeat protein